MNWTIKEIKLKGKLAFRNNYWKAVAIAFIMSVVASGVGGGFSGNTSSITSVFNSDKGSNKGSNKAGKEYGLIGEVSDSETSNSESSDSNESGSDVTESESPGSSVSVEPDGSYSINIDTSSPETLEDGFDNMPTSEKIALGIVMSILFIVVFTVIFVIAMLVNVFLYNPLEVGCNRFFFRNLEEPAKISNIVYAFDNNYKNVIKILFFRDLYIIGWSLLFIIPGWIKTYEYRMVTFILAENPDISKEEAFGISKEMMMGNKWKAFLLDLSFIGWILLSICTCGLLTILFVNPYRFSTNAALYEKLRYEGTFEENLELSNEKNVNGSDNYSIAENDNESIEKSIYR